MKKIFLILLLSLLPAFALETVKLKPIIDKYCVECHGPEKQKGKVRLDDLTELDAKAWFDIYDQINEGEMPPEDETQLPADKKKFAVENILDHLKTYEEKSKTAMRRLNKREYSNSLRDLLGLYDVYDPGERIFADEVSHGFDTEAKSLVISDYQLLQYISSASKSLSHAVKSHSPKAPEEEVINIKAGQLGPKSRDCGPQDKNTYITRSRTQVHGGKKAVISTPGFYKISFTASGVDRFFYKVPMAPVKDKFTLALGVKASNDNSTTNNGTPLKTFELDDNSDKYFEHTIWINEGYYPYLQATNVGSKPITQLRSAVRRKDLPKDTSLNGHRLPGVKITSFSITGPFYKEWPIPSYRQTFDSVEALNIKDETVRRTLIANFLFKAFRGQNKQEDLDLYYNYLNQVQEKEQNWQSSIQKTMSAILSSPKFLFLSENDGELNSTPLASRLSYLIWSTTPDKELLDLAVNGKLKDSSVYRQQVNRLLEDPRSENFMNSFVTQWLKLGALGSMRPDSKDKRFKMYDPKIEEDLKQETKLFFKHIFNNNLSVKEFLNSDYTFVNKELARYYGIPYKGDGGFTKTAVPAGSLRGGILGHASVLTLTSNGVDTSPIERGIWVLEYFLGTPPPPAPAEVPALTPDTTGAVTVRQLLDKHRTDPACASCHKKMDPIGLALESFDPIGRVRSKYDNKTKVETDDVYKGEAFKNVDGLKQILLKNTDSFARSLIIKIAEYGKGRKLSFKDYAIVEKLLKESSKKDHTFKDLFLSVMNSDLIKNR